MIAGHNLLDGIVMQGQSFPSIIWYLLHQEQGLTIRFRESDFLTLSPNSLDWIDGSGLFVRNILQKGL